MAYPPAQWRACEIESWRLQPWRCWADVALMRRRRRRTCRAGDASRGKTLVESNGCFDCHRIGEQGSRLGPNLSDIGARRTPDRLQQALIAPDEEVLFGNRFVRFVTKDGATITGRLLNQDAISVQLITPKEELKTYLRANIREYAIVDKGLMPSEPGQADRSAGRRHRRLSELAERELALICAPGASSSPAGWSAARLECALVPRPEISDHRPKPHSGSHHPA